jgi:hypothetical protein
MQAFYAIRLAVFGELIKGTSPATEYIIQESETLYRELLAISLDEQEIQTQKKL